MALGLPAAMVPRNGPTRRGISAAGRRNTRGCRSIAILLVRHSAFVPADAAGANEDKEAVRKFERGCRWGWDEGDRRSEQGKHEKFAEGYSRVPTTWQKTANLLLNVWLTTRDPESVAQAIGAIFAD